MLALLACRRETVEQADPDEVASAFGKPKQRIGRRHGADPRPAGGDCECGGEQALSRPARGFAEPPDYQRGEAGRCERMTPEGNQRAHLPPPSVNFTDMSRGVAKLYKDVMNASGSAGLKRHQLHDVEPGFEMRLRHHQPPAV